MSVLCRPTLMIPKAAAEKRASAHAKVLPSAVRKWQLLLFCTQFQINPKLYPTVRPLHNSESIRLSKYPLKILYLYLSSHLEAMEVDLELGYRLFSTTSTTRAPLTTATTGVSVLTDALL